MTITQLVSFIFIICIGPLPIVLILANLAKITHEDRIKARRYH